MKENMISLLEIMSRMISTTINDDGYKRFITDTNIITKKVKKLPYKDAAETGTETIFKVKDSIKISKCKKVVISFEIKDDKENDYFKNKYHLKECVFLPKAYFIDKRIIRAAEYSIVTESIEKKNNKYKIEIDGKSFCASLYLLYEYYTEKITVDYQRYLKIIELFEIINNNKYKFELIQKDKSYELTNFDIMSDFCK